MLIKILIVGSGGFIGSILRYLVSGWAYKISDLASFPIGTLVVNILGCLIIGFLGEFSASRTIFSSEVRIFLFIGILGGFTTFSTFGYESVSLLRQGAYFYSILNILLHFTICLLAVWCGIIIAKLLGV